MYVNITLYVYVKELKIYSHTVKLVIEGYYVIRSQFKNPQVKHIIHKNLPF